MKIRGLVCSLSLCVLFAACGDSGGSNPTATRKSAGEVVYYNPTHLPEGMKIKNVTMDEPEGEIWVGKVGRKVGNGYRDVVTVFIHADDAPLDYVDDELRGKGKELDLNGAKALLLEDPTADVSLLWSNPGVEIVVNAKAGASADAVEVARRLRVGPQDDIGKSSIAGASTGMQPIGTWLAGGRGRGSYTIEIGTPGDDEIAARVQVAVIPGVQPAMAGYGFEFEPLPGVGNNTTMIHHYWTGVGAEREETPNVVWAERPDLLVYVNGTMTEAEVIAIAKGLREESEKTWRAHMPVETG